MNAVLKINRFSEQGTIPLRSNRFYQEGDKWFFSIRAELDHGPFDSFDDARTALTAFIQELLSSKI